MNPELLAAMMGSGGVPSLGGAGLAPAGGEYTNQLLDPTAMPWMSLFARQGYSSLMLDPRAGYGSLADAPTGYAQLNAAAQQQSGGGQ